MAFANSSPYMESIREGLIGTPHRLAQGSGFGWIALPGFLLDRVKAPILIPGHSADFPAGRVGVVRGPIQTQETR